MAISKSRQERSVLIGSGIGGIVGATTVGLLAGFLPEGPANTKDIIDGAAGGFFVGAAFGAIVGGVVGAPSEEELQKEHVLEMRDRQNLEAVAMAASAGGMPKAAPVQQAQTNGTQTGLHAQA